jgi:ferredoxin-like protein FixX
VLVDAGVPGDPHLECGFCRVPCEHLGHADRKRSA